MESQGGGTGQTIESELCCLNGDGQSRGSAVPGSPPHGAALSHQLDCPKTCPSVCHPLPARQSNPESITGLTLNWFNANNTDTCWTANPGSHRKDTLSSWSRRPHPCQALPTGLVRPLDGRSRVLGGGRASADPKPGLSARRAPCGSQSWAHEASPAPGHGAAATPPLRPTRSGRPHPGSVRPASQEVHCGPAVPLTPSAPPAASRWPKPISAKVPGVRPGQRAAAQVRVQGGEGRPRPSAARLPGSRAFPVSGPRPPLVRVALGSGPRDRAPSGFTSRPMFAHPLALGMPGCGQERRGLESARALLLPLASPVTCDGASVPIGFPP